MAVLLLQGSPPTLSPLGRPRSAWNRYAKTSSASLLSAHHEISDSKQILRKSLFHEMSSLCKEGLIREAFTLLYVAELEETPIGPEIYAEMLQACVYQRSLSQGKQIHARVIKKGDFFHRNEYLETKLVIFYSKCRVSDAAVNLFQRQRSRNVFGWAAMIGYFCEEGLYEEAVSGFCEMMANGFIPDNFVIPNALKACCAAKMVNCGVSIHGYALKMGYSSCVFVQSSIIDFYGKLGVMEDARKVFNKMPEKNSVAWNSILVGYVHNGLDREAMRAFSDMRFDGAEPTRVTIASFLSAAANQGALEEGKQAHTIAIVSGLDLDIILSSSLINFYCKLSSTDDAEIIFVRSKEKDTVIWNLLISGYLQESQIEKSLLACRKMMKENLRFDSVTLSSILSASAVTRNLNLGEEAHCYCIRNNLDTDPSVSGSIIDMYAKCGKIEISRRVFDTARNKDLILWNNQLSAYAQSGMSGEALKLFYQMQLESITPNIVSWNSVILGMLRSGQVDKALDMFFQMQKTEMKPNLVTWTTIISGALHNGRDYEALEMFRLMQTTGLDPNLVGIVAVISACSNLASLRHGKAVHGYSIRRCFCNSIQVSTSLVDMYAKSGNLNLAQMVFDAMPKKELPLYNAMISGYSLHSRAREAVQLFDEMRMENVSPDPITFTGLLTACSHGGLVEEGFKLFSEMTDMYNLTPGIEHYGCIVSLLTRQGKIEEALKFMKEMPFDPDAKMLGSLLSACRDHQRMNLAEHLSRMLFELEPENPANDVALSNIYAADGKWDAASITRGNMREKGMRKDPGCSWIQVGNDVMMFMSGDRAHTEIDQIHTILQVLQRDLGSLDSEKMFLDSDQE